MTTQLTAVEGRSRIPKPFRRLGVHITVILLMILWLVPTTPLSELPVLPKFNQGQPPALTFVRPVDSRNRLVIRLWQVAELSDAGSAQPAPLWSGILTAEQSRTEFGLIGTARTTNDSTPALQAVDDAVRGAGLNVATHTLGGSPLLLVW